MQVLIADSGATKTDWAYIENGKPVFLQSSGLHPAYLDPEKALKELQHTLAGLHPDLIIFYGAGCYSGEAAQPVADLLSRHFPGCRLRVEDDLAAVAHAYLADGDGLAGILGTGSASGYFKKGKKSDQVPSLGFVLGDEGSAADIGKRILKRALRKDLSNRAIRQVEERIGGLTYHRIVDRIYREPMPSRFLAETTRKVFQQEAAEELIDIARESIEAYLESHLKKYPVFPKASIVLSGGVVKHFQVLIGEVLAAHGAESVTLAEGVISALADRQIQKHSSL